MRATLVTVGCWVLASSTVATAATPVTVFLDRAGRVVDHDGAQVEIPRFGGGDRAWNGIVACVRDQFSPFQIDIVDRPPARGPYITAVIGGHASLLGLDDATTNGVGPYAANRVLRDAVVHVFSRVGTGERDIENLCAVTVHEVSHALGLDHSYVCGDVMSYFLDRCGPRRILDREGPCGEESPRTCGDGARTQSSYRKLAAAVGLRTPEPEPEPDDDSWADPWSSPGEDPAPADDELDDGAGEPSDLDDDDPIVVRDRDGRRYIVHEVHRHRGRRWLILRRIR